MEVAIYILFGLYLLFGIFVGIQAAAWNDETDSYSWVGLVLHVLNVALGWGPRAIWNWFRSKW